MKVIAYFLPLFLATSAMLMVTSGLASDYTLEIFGNANMDNAIDEKDVAYVEGVIKGTNVATNLSDANYDGMVDQKDIEHIEKIMDGEEPSLTIIDSAKRIVTVEMPIQRVVPILSYGPPKALKIIGEIDKIAGVGSDIDKWDYLFPELLGKPRVGEWTDPDYEAIAELDPDLVIQQSSYASEAGSKLETFNIPVVALDFHFDQRFDLEMEKLGYLFGKEALAKECISWRKNYEEMINNSVDSLQDEEKERVVILWGWSKNPHEIKLYGKESSGDLPCIVAGGNNIADELGMKYPVVDSEWILKENPDFIILQLAPDKWGWNDTKYLSDIMVEVIKACGWENLDAIKNKRFYIYSSEIAWGPESPVRLVYWAKWFYPERFSELVPEKIYMEYLKKFMKIDCPTNTIFVYQKE
jgi:iron complex transport system substrate-binding protein